MNDILTVATLVLGMIVLFFVVLGSQILITEIWKLSCIVIDFIYAKRNEKNDQNQ